ncbi:MAG: cell division protein FtsQ/DivIB [Gammaproteobacteria bacterium]
MKTLKKIRSTNKKRIKRKSATRLKKVTVQSFSKRDAWDVIVVIMLLTIVVYFSAYVRNNHFAVSAWPVIENVNVSGRIDAIDHDALKNIIRAHAAGGFLRVQMEPLEKELEKLTWVRQASVQRFWPDTLSVNILQHSPIARWGDTGLMNTYGDLFFPNNIKPYRALPMLYGEELRAKELARTFENSMQQLRPLKLHLRGMFEDERQSIVLVLEDGLVIAIGDGNVSEKIERFITAHDQYLAKNLNEVKKVDLRYTNGLAVEWKSPQFAQNLVQHLGMEPNL